ncbi:hypothetical protein [Clostridium tunisiense]|nr:hypothetical protein [Clostridium tunisiense]
MDKNTKKILEQSEKITDKKMFQLLEEVEEINAEGEVFGLGCIFPCM